MITGNTAREVGSETGKENNQNKCITKQVSTMGNWTLILLWESSHLKGEGVGVFMRQFLTCWLRAAPREH